MSLQKSKIKSIQDMWKAMQELSTKANRNKIEEAALQVCTQFFISSEDFISMFEDCMGALADAPSSVSTSPAPAAGTELDPMEEGMALFAGMSIAGLGLTPDPQAQMTPELETQQVNEFHSMMNSVDFGCPVQQCDSDYKP